MKITLLMAGMLCAGTIAFSQDAKKMENAVQKTSPQPSSLAHYGRMHHQPADYKKDSLMKNQAATKQKANSDRSFNVLIYDSAQTPAVYKNRPSLTKKLN